MRICQQCGNQLSGKQRLFCSEACRKRYDRAGQAGQKNGQTVSAIVRELGGNVRKLSGFSNNRMFEVRVTVRFSSNQPPGEWDYGLINEYLRARIAKIVHMVIREEHADWQIRVEVVSKYNGRG